MSKRYAVLYSDGSFSVSSGETDLIESKKSLCFVKSDEDTKFVEVEIRVTNVIEADNKLKLVGAQTVTCSCCGEIIDVPQEADQQQIQERYAP